MAEAGIEPTALEPLVVLLRGPAAETCAALRPGHPALFVGRLIPHLVDVNAPTPDDSLAGVPGVRFVALRAVPTPIRALRCRVVSVDLAAGRCVVDVIAEEDLFIDATGDSRSGELTCDIGDAGVVFEDGLDPQTLAAELGEIVIRGALRRVNGGHRFHCSALARQ